MSVAKYISKLRNLRANQTRLIAYFLIAVGILGLLLSFRIYSNEPKPPKLSFSVKSVAVVAAPSSVKQSPAVVAQYSVPPTSPKYITIPSIGVGQTPIIRLGLLANGQIATPDNIYETGWYDGSSLPGQTGAMFIYGHVSSWTADGVFYNLKKLVTGDDITITRGDNQTYTYKVVRSEVYPYNNVPMNTVLSPSNPKVPGLNLMTCTGSVIKGTSEFNERLVVYTNLVTS